MTQPLDSVLKRLAIWAAFWTSLRSTYIFSSIPGPIIAKLLTKRNIGVLAAAHDLLLAACLFYYSKGGLVVTRSVL